MNAVRFYKEIIDSRKGKISLLISLGGLLIAIISTMFTLSFGGKLKEVESQLFAVRIGLKEIEGLTDELASDYNHAKSSSVNPSNVNFKKGPKSNYVVDSLGIYNDSVLHTNDGIPFEGQLQVKDSVKTEDTVKIIIPTGTLSTIQGLDMGKLATSESVSIVSTNLVLTKAIYALKKTNSQLLSEKMYLIQKLREMEAEHKQELAALRSSRGKGDDTPSKGTRSN